MDCIPSMTNAEVLKITTSAWDYETSGKNWVGRKARASTDRDEILSLRHDAGAVMLLLLLRVSHSSQPLTTFLANRKVAELVNKTKEQVAVLDAALAEELQKSLHSLGRQLSALSEKFVQDYLPLTERLRQVVALARI